MHWRELKVWQKAHALVLMIYKVTSTYPKQELYGLTSQTKRSAASIPANIVEGQSRNTSREYLMFLYNARGSVEETRYHLLLAKDLRYIQEKDYIVLEGQYEELSKMLNALIKTIKRSSEEGSRSKKNKGSLDKEGGI